MLLRTGLYIPSRSIATSAVRQRPAQPDLISGAFLKQIRDLTAKQKAAGGTLVNTSPEIKKQLDEQLNRLANKFQLPSTDVVSHLAAEFEKPTVESSVAAVTEGRSLDDMIAEVKKSLSAYEQERSVKKKAEAEQQAALSKGTDVVVEPKPAHLFNHPVYGRPEIQD